MFKFIFPHGGWGLGNDLIPWCKAHILEKQLRGEASVLGPAWGNNPRRYHRYFGTSRFDHLYCRAVLKLVPKIPFTEQIYRDSGSEDFEAACAYFIEKHGLRRRNAYAVTITGLWGAFSGIASARNFALDRLTSTNFTLDNVAAIFSRADPNKLAVGVHVRLGDFADTRSLNGAVQEGMVNVRLSNEWYLRVLASLESGLGSRHIQYFVCSDGTREEIGLMFSGKDYLFCSELGNSDISDMLCLSRCDLLVCSVSTFSAWAAFLSRAPYVWYGAKPEPAYGEAALDRFNALGLHLPELDTDGGNGRGYLAESSGAVPEALMSRLAQRLREKNRSPV